MYSYRMRFIDTMAVRGLLLRKSAQRKSQLHKMSLTQGNRRGAD